MCSVSGADASRVKAPAKRPVQRDLGRRHCVHDCPDRIPPYNIADCESDNHCRERKSPGAIEPSNKHMRNKPTERKDLQHEIANEGMYLIVGKDGLELWRAEENGKNVFTGMVFPNVEAAHSYVFGKDDFLGFR